MYASSLVYVENLVAAFDEALGLALANMEAALAKPECTSRTVEPGWRLDDLISALEARTCVDGDAATLALDRELERLDTASLVVALGPIERTVADAEADLEAAIERRAQAADRGADRDELAGHDLELAEYQATVERLREVRELVRQRGIRP